MFSLCETILISADYVCVIDFGFFELSLRASDGKDQVSNFGNYEFVKLYCLQFSSFSSSLFQQKQPRSDLRASNNILHIRTCVDSCRALQELLCYFASDGDLRDANSSQEQMTDKVKYSLTLKLIKSSIKEYFT